MVVHVEFHSLIGGANCVNGGTAPSPKRLVRTLLQLILNLSVKCIFFGVEGQQKVFRIN